MILGQGKYKPNNARHFQSNFQQFKHISICIKTLNASSYGILRQMTVFILEFRKREGDLFVKKI